MIFKSDLVDAINDLSHDLTTLSIRVHDLELKNIKLERHLASAKRCSCCKKDDKLEKAVRVAKQPRNKDGKFAKKK